MGNDSPENVLQQCLDLLESGYTIDQCLETYPEMVSQLKPLLLLVQSTTQAGATISPSRETQNDIYQTVVDTWSKLPRNGPGGILSLVRPMARTALVFFLIVTALAGTGWGTIHAASQSLPGDTLHSVKIAKEQFLLRITPGTFDKAKRLSLLTQERIDEMHRMALQGRNEQHFGNTVDRMSDHAEKMVEMLGGKIPIPQLDLDTKPAVTTRQTIRPNPLISNKRHQEIKRLLTSQLTSQRPINPRLLRHISTTRRDALTKAFRDSQLVLFAAIHALDQLEEQN